MIKEEELIFYEIYPKSFCDWNGDGIGDLRGILAKLDYIKNLGVNGVWLTPFFKTENVDNGYDISDYREIEQSVGTLAQLDELIKKLHENGILIILDLVANHTSTAHKWFREAKSSKDNRYRNYYIWRKTPPNDWQSIFGGPAWQYESTTGEYYLHSFAVEQADLNWDNPKVREEMKGVVDFWLARGVDGFRCDVLDMISKDFEKNQNGGGPHLHEYIRELFSNYQDKGIFTVGECWSADTENARLFCGKDRKELTTVFSFGHLCLEKGRFSTKKPSMSEVCRRISNWQIASQNANVLPTVFLENHDQPRSVSRIGDEGKYRYESATALGGITLLHKGVPFLFQGQEIGMTNSRHEKIEDFNDVESRQYYEANKGKIRKEELIKQINFGGRDNARCMMPWDEKCKNSWIKAYTSQAEINVARDFEAKKSVYAFYQKLIALRKKEKCLTYGEYQCEEISEKRYIFQRVYKKDKIVIVCNFKEETSFDKFDGEVLINNYPSIESKLQPYQLIVYKQKQG